MLQNPILNPKKPFAQLVADDGDTGLIVKYIGSEASATVTVSASGDITFKHGAVGAEAVDPTIDSGGDDDGVIDVSDASANTFGEIVDMINASANWSAYLVGVLRADNANASTGSLLARTETTLVPKVTETPLYKDTSKVLNLGIRVGSRTKVGGSEEKSAAEIYQIISTNTFGSGTSIVYIYEINDEAKTETLVYQKAGGATTVEQTQSFVTNGRGSLGVSKQGNHLLVKLVGSAACTGNMTVVGATGMGL